MTDYITAKEATEAYFTQIKSLNPSINPESEGSDFWAKGNAIGNMISGLSQTIYLRAQDTFVQTSSGEGVDVQLAQWGQIPRHGALPASGSCKVSVLPAESFVIPKDAPLTYQLTNSVYTVVEDTVVSTTVYTEIPVHSQKVGVGFQVPKGEVLKLNAPINNYSELTVDTMTDGSEIESDLHCISRLLTNIQQPRLGGAVGDYETWASSIENVTGAKAIPNLQFSGSVSVIVLAGGSDINTILETPATAELSYDRSASASLLVHVRDYIETQRPVQANFLVNGVTTQIVPASGETLNVQVSLAQGLSLDSEIPNTLEEGQHIIIKNLIMREIRRAIIESPLGGTSEGGETYILISDIAQTLDVGLSGSPLYSGLYGSVLLDRKVTYSGGGNIPVTEQEDGNQNYPFVYDILYDSIVLSEI